MAIEVKMPKLGQTSDEVRIVRWLIVVGEQVEKGQPLCEVENDKTTLELESFVAGTVVSLNATEGESVTAGTVIAVVGSPEDKSTAASQPITSFSPNTPKEGNKPVSSMQSPPRQRIMIENLARKAGVDLTQIRGTGPHGIVTRDDVRRGADKGEIAEDRTSKDDSPQSSIALSDQQVAVANAVTYSRTHIPHYYIHTTVYCDAMMEVRRILERNTGHKVPFEAFFVKAIATALLRHPRTNVRYSANHLEPRGEISVSIAVSANNELYSPVIKHADSKSIIQIAEDIQLLATKARSGALGNNESTGGSFLLSNLGMYPIDSFEAIITVPQTGTLSTGRIRKSVEVDEDARMEIRSICQVTAGFDHRAVNGAQGAEFMTEIKGIIETELGAQ